MRRGQTTGHHFQASIRRASSSPKKQIRSSHLWCHTAAENYGYISVAATSPDHRRRGIVTALILAALLRFRGQGLREAIIDVRADNTAAILCYESVGFRKVGEFKADERCRTPQGEDMT